MPISDILDKKAAETVDEYLVKHIY
ncbi:predicted protein [Fibroporia radiculosa]|uniref:Uncharacterized protein n=1 Tax=Fibroporia radiculosa TaxID=599839 RepID=J4GJ22_9APHY|nr:predicted protein [Fibroporia radiculosa]